MAKIRKVLASGARGMNMSWNFNLFSGPMWTVRCGSCSHIFQKRLPLVDNPEVICPACSSINVLKGIVVR